mgnify:CR=1 FL=1
MIPFRYFSSKHSGVRLLLNLVSSPRIRSSGSCPFFRACRGSYSASKIEGRGEGLRGGKKDSTVGRPCDLPWVVSTTYSRFFRRSTVGRFLAPGEGGCRRGEKSRVCRVGTSLGEGLRRRDFSLRSSAQILAVRRRRTEGRRNALVRDQPSRGAPVGGGAFARGKSASTSRMAVDYCYLCVERITAEQMHPPEGMIPKALAPPLLALTTTPQHGCTASIHPPRLYRRHDRHGREPRDGGSRTI